MTCVPPPLPPIGPRSRLGLRVWVAALLLSACSLLQGPSAIDVTPVANDVFERTLVAGYLELSDEEAHEDSWSDARAFRDRARRAAQGEDIEPDLIESRALSKTARTDLTAARAAMMDVLDQGGRTLAGEAMAHAQVRFSCWLHEQEENIEIRKITLCRQGFEQALAEAGKALNQGLVLLLPDLDGSVGALSVSTPAGTSAVTTAHSAVAEPPDGPPRPLGSLDDRTVRQLFGKALAAQPTPPVRFILYFLVGTDRLTPESETVLPAVRAAVVGHSVPEVLVVGHADSVGPARLNDRLALQRAQTVARAIVALGAPAHAVAVKSFGAHDPLVPTPRGSAEPRNRRVEVMVR